MGRKVECTPGAVQCQLPCLSLDANNACVSAGTFFTFDSMAGDKDKEVERVGYCQIGCSHLVLNAFIFFIHSLLTEEPAETNFKALSLGLTPGSTALADRKAYLPPWPLVFSLVALT